MSESPSYWEREMARALSVGADPTLAAREYLRVIESHEVEWAASKIGAWVFPTAEISAALLADAGDRVADGYARAVCSLARPDLRLVEVPLNERTALDLAQLGWLALLRHTWQPLPLSPTSNWEYTAIADLLSAAAAGNPEEINSAIEVMVDFYDPKEDRNDIDDVLISLLRPALRCALKV